MRNQLVVHFQRLLGSVSCCRFGGHEDKIVTNEPEGDNGETKIWS